ncbi:MAG: hypothetical protein JXO72_15540 [Vicinamibacteria bacterium]|nr:hypothetical protein [Vicinamibacteria bacterium]
MRSRLLNTMPILVALWAAPSIEATEYRGFALDVLMDGAPRPELHGRGKVYVEALRDEKYALRLHNPLPCRVAVALSVDGLNTIDARHTSPKQARKWVLDPYETIEIEGWQVSGRHARLFYFTGERDSYAADLGHTRDLGVIEAVFFRERTPRWIHRPWRSDKYGDSRAGGRKRAREGTPGGASPRIESESAREETRFLDDDFAATGMGDRVDHGVRHVHIALEREPSATLRIRYEFRPQLARLGLLPPHGRDPLDRRETARGFDGPYCPE